MENKVIIFIAVAVVAVLTMGGAIAGIYHSSKKTVQEPVSNSLDSFSDSKTSSKSLSVNTPSASVLSEDQSSGVAQPAPFLTPFRRNFLIVTSVLLVLCVLAVVGVFAYLTYKQRLADQSFSEHADKLAKDDQDSSNSAAAAAEKPKQNRIVEGITFVAIFVSSLMLALVVFLIYRRSNKSLGHDKYYYLSLLS